MRDLFPPPSLLFCVFLVQMMYEFGKVFTTRYHVKKTRSLWEKEWNFFPNKLGLFLSRCYVWLVTCSRSCIETHKVCRDGEGCDYWCQKRVGESTNKGRHKGGPNTTKALFIGCPTWQELVVFQGLFQSVTSFLIINSHQNKHRQNPNNKFKKWSL